MAEVGSADETEEPQSTWTFHHPDHMDGLHCFFGSDLSGCDLDRLSGLGARLAWGWSDRSCMDGSLCLGFMLAGYIGRRFYFVMASVVNKFRFPEWFGGLGPDCCCILKARSRAAGLYVHL